MLGIEFSLQFGIGVYYVYARELSASEVAATSLTIFTIVSFVGTLTAPPLGGWLAEIFQRETAFLSTSASVPSGMVC